MRSTITSARPLERPDISVEVRLSVVRLGVLLVVVCLAGASAATARQSDPVRLYNEAMARETALRAELSSPATRDAAPTRRRLQTLVNAYRDLARLFPASGIGDKALWQGAMLASDAFWIWGDGVDRATALRMFEALRTTYPVSTLTKQSPAHIRRLTGAPVAAPAPETSTLRPAAAVAQQAAPLPAPAPAPAPPASPPAATPAASQPPTPPALLTAIRQEAMPGVVRVTLQIDRETVFRGEQLENPSRVFVDLQQTRAQEPLRDAVIPVTTGGVQRIRVGRHPGGLTRVVLDLAGPGRFSVYSLYDPYRVVIDVEAPRVAVAPPAGPSGPSAPLAARTAPVRVALRARVAEMRPGAASSAVRAVATLAPGPPELPPPVIPATTARGDYSLSRQLGLGIARIVIDAGHGGHDPGAKVRGLTEASLTLDIALRLEQLLRRQPGVEVVQTRRTDAYVSLEDRAEIANRAGADLFISIHANASNNPRTRGVETYVLNFAGSPGAERVAARENAGSMRTMRDLPDIVKAIALNDKVDESREFARFVQDALFAQLRRHDRTLRNLGVKQAPFMVLLGATMPSVLTEVAFVTNREDAGLLRSEKYRQDVAQALLAGITRYQQSLKRAPAVAAQ